MKTKTMFCALALLATVAASGLAAEASNYVPHRTTVVDLSDNAEIVVVAKLERVEDVALTEVGLDSQRYKDVDNGKTRGGQDYIRREAVLTIREVIKGNAQAGTELRFVSMRQLKYANYDADLKNGDCLFFLSRRSEDSRLVVLQDERGTVSAAEVGGDLNRAVDFVRGHLDNGSTSAAGVQRMIQAITLSGDRLSVDCAMELSWSHTQYAPNMTEEQRQSLQTLMTASPVGSEERNQLITAVGRHKPEGALQSLLALMFADSNWGTTSLASMSLEYVDRGAAISALLAEWPNANDDTRKMVIVRSLGLIRPKAGHDGVTVRQATLDLVGSLLVAGTSSDLLREALIASRDLRAEDAHINALKKLIDERATNGLKDADVKAAIIALAAARKVVVNQSGPDAEAVLARKYLEDLGAADPLLKQVVDVALKTPWTTLILGADGRGH
jgi:hypothetical protein